MTLRLSVSSLQFAFATFVRNVTVCLNFAFYFLQHSYFPHVFASVALLLAVVLFLYSTNVIADGQTGFLCITHFHITYICPLIPTTFCACMLYEMKNIQYLVCWSVCVVECSDAMPLTCALFTVRFFTQCAY